MKWRVEINHSKIKFELKGIIRTLDVVSLPIINMPYFLLKRGFDYKNLQEMFESMIWRLERECRTLLMTKGVNHKNSPKFC